MGQIGKKLGQIGWDKFDMGQIDQTPYDLTLLMKYFRLETLNLGLIITTQITTFP